MAGWKLIIHGGAKEIAVEEECANREGLAEAIDLGRAILGAGGRAMDAVEACVRKLEDDPAFNAGRGSALTNSGTIEMSAAVMDGRTLDVGAVAALAHVRNPVSVARAMLREYEVLMVAAGAERFADSIGAERCTLDKLIAEPGRASSGHDTVGAVALDPGGDFAVAISTGGLPGQKPGRVGDSPLPGCGFYAENSRGAVALSGHGEGIARLALASRIMHAMAELHPDDATLDCLRLMDRVGGDSGAIAIDAQGRIGWSHNSENFAVAMMAEGDQAPAITLKKGKR